MRDCNWATSTLAASAFAMSAIVLGMCISMAAVTGCERKERVIDVNTPGGDVEVERDIDTGEVTVDVDDQ